MKRYIYHLVERSPWPIFSSFACVIFSWFFKKAKKLEGINFYKTYYSTSMCLSVNTWKKTNAIFNKLFNTKIRDNHLSIVYKQKKQNMFEIYKEYYEYFSEMLREYAPQLNNVAFINNLIKKNYLNNDFSNKNVLIGRMHVDLFLKNEKLHKNLLEKDKELIAIAYKKAYEEHPAIFYLNEIQSKVVILHTNITKNVYQKYLNDVFGIKNKIEVIEGNIRFPFGIIEGWHISVFFKNEFENMLKEGVIYSFNNEGQYIEPEQMHFINLYLNKLVRTGDLYIIDNYIYQPNGNKKLYKIVVNAKTNEEIFSIMVVTRENKNYLQNILIKNKQIKTTILPEELFEDLNKFQPEIIDKKD
jgi:hypothetical protein